MRRLGGELRFLPLGELDAGLTVYLLESCLHTLEYLRDLAHAQAERAEQDRQRNPPNLGLTSNYRSHRGSESQREGTSASRPSARAPEVESARGEREAEAPRGERDREPEKGRKKEARAEDERERKRRRRG